MNYLKRYPFILLIIINLLVYFPLITAIKTVNPDAQIIYDQLFNLSGPIDYITKLFHFQTIDFQPIRDLTFFLDLFFFKKFNLNISIFQNFFLWIGCCYLIYRIQRIVFQEREVILCFLFLLLFSVNPLFTYTISWGIARKHILSFFFILFATLEVVTLKELTGKKSLKFTLLYLCSCLSQPITILWPLWTFIFLKRKKDTNVFHLLKYLFPLAIAFLFLSLTNFFYYQHSDIFRHHYASKTSQLFNISDKILAFGHYHFQIFFPFKLAFNYELGDYSVLIGLLLFVLSSFFVYKKKVTPDVLIWLMPGYLSLLVILNTPQHLFDSYLLFLSFSVFMLINYFLPSRTNRFKMSLIIFLVFIFGLISHVESKKWLNPVTLTESSFQNRPNCKNALNFLKMTYESHLKVSDELRTYLKNYDCLSSQGATQYKATSHTAMISNILFHEDLIPVEERIQKLKMLSENNLIPHLTLAALYLKNSKPDEADLVIVEIIKKMENNSISGKEFHPITAYYVHPYCQKKSWQECLNITNKLSKKPNNLYY
jgi:hypothetical protein